MKILRAATAALLLAGCAPALPLATAEEDAAGRQMSAPPPGMASLYVYEGSRDAHYTISVGQKTLGILGRHNWLRVDLEPGRHDLRCAAPILYNSVVSLLVDLKSGEVKYISADISLATMSCRLEVESLETARPLILAGKRVRELR